jgi:2-polyprenyl-3-methyl-5-hydroxy-6-metoxy-1,4-benzoquinol methylase
MTNEIIDLAKIEQFAREIGVAINGLVKFTDLLVEIKESLDHIRLSQEHRYLTELMKHKEDMAYMREQLERIGLPKIDVYERKLNFIKEKLNENEWPQAIDISCVPHTEADETKRADNIIDLIVTEFLKDLKFLDYGCGMGYVAHAATKRGVSLSVGYDLKTNWGNFQDTTRLLLTGNFQDVLKHAPYDVVLLYDVLDHYKGNPLEALHRIKEILSPRGRVYIRNHPWCSRHGTHLYDQVNKAFLHLVLDEVELARLGGYASEHTIKLVRPVDTYREWFRKSGFNIKNEIILTSPVEPFFTSFDNAIIKERVTKHWDGEDPTRYMSLQFVDYLLEPAESSQQVI